MDLMGRAGRGCKLPMCGESMRPTLCPGHVLAVEFSPKTLRRGDLILFRQADCLVVHRLVRPAPPGKEERPLMTRGDGVRNLDPPVEPSHVVGRVIAIQGNGVWRDLTGRWPRAYSWMLALHDRAWAALSAVAGRCDAILRRVRGSVSLESLVWRTDRQVLHLVHRLFFLRVHPRIDPPPEMLDADLKVEGIDSRPR